MSASSCLVWHRNKPRLHVGVLLHRVSLPDACARNCEGLDDVGRRLIIVGDIDRPLRPLTVGAQVLVHGWDPDRIQNEKIRKLDMALNIA